MLANLFMKVSQFKSTNSRVGLLILLVLTVSSASASPSELRRSSGNRISNPTGTNWYVAPAPQGSDTNDGSARHPWASIGIAAQTAKPGDTVWIKAGTYVPKDIIRIGNSGTEAAPITFRGETGGPVIIDGQRNVPNYFWDGVFTLEKRNWIIFDGLTVINSRWFGFSAKDCEGVIVRNCSTKFTGGSGVYMNSCNHVKVERCSVRHACDTPKTDPQRFTQECISLGDCKDFEIDYNEVYDRTSDDNMGGEGIDTKGYCQNGKVHHNILHDLARVGIYMDSWNGLLTNIDDYANTIYDCSSGITVEGEEGGTSRGVKIHDNLIYNCDRIGIRLAGFLKNGPIQDASIYQNTVYHCGYHGTYYENCALLVEANNPLNRNFVVANNVFSDNVNQVRTAGQAYLVLDRNLLHGPTLVSGSNVLSDDPKFVDPIKHNFHLKKGSPGLGKAKQEPLSQFDHDGRPRHHGTRSADMGAFESP
jgi:hypothetical protein